MMHLLEARIITKRMELIHIRRFHLLRDNSRDREAPVRLKMRALGATQSSTQDGTD